MKVLLDGKIVARLRPSRSVKLQGTGEPQSLVAKMDWVTSDAVTVVDGPDKQIFVEFSFANGPFAIATRAAGASIDDGFDDDEPEDGATD
jgi:hypothetical protein